jgi:glycolate oxidase iron-sulfur subunit
MKTDFTAVQRQDPAVRASEAEIRKCVHCGFCTATCPTYALLGDELDSPRGRIYLMQQMLQDGGRPSPETVKHVDRCLSCLSCKTTCPSGVNYMRLVDHARTHIESHHRRPWRQRTLRWLLAEMLTRPTLFRIGAAAAALARPFATAAPKPFRRLIQAAPKLVPTRPAPGHGVSTPLGDRRYRIALLKGCVQPAIAPQIDAAATRLLNRFGAEVVVAQPACCGALPHHMGREEHARTLARRQVAAWSQEIAGQGLDAIVTTASGCGVTVKDYGHLLRDDPALAEAAATVSSLAVDVTELLERLDLSVATFQADVAGVTVAYHGPCSLQHGQGLRDTPARLLQRVGFQVAIPKEPHLCCGSAGVYNILQPEIAGQLQQRKAEHIDRLAADVVATGNIGCLHQLETAVKAPVVHTVELLDWATGGSRPAALGAREVAPVQASAAELPHWAIFGCPG